MKPGIFICYRRSDSSGAAGRIYDRLTAEFGADRVFMDVDDIAAGVDFEEAIQNRIGNAAAVIVIIGPSWETDPKATAEIDMTGGPDYVRLEIAAAFNASVRVIPILIDDAKMPTATELPPKLQKLAKINALEVRHSRFESDVATLVNLLKDFHPRRRLAIPVVVGTGLMIVASIVGWQTVSSKTSNTSLTNLASWEITTPPTAIVGERVDITITPRDPNGNIVATLENNPVLSIVGANTHRPALSQTGGIFHASYTPQNQGTDNFIVTFNGDTIPNGPFTTTIQQTPTRQRATASIEFDTRAVATYYVFSAGRVLYSGRVNGPTVVTNVPTGRQLTLQLVWELANCSDKWESTETLTPNQRLSIPTKVNCSS